MEHVADPLVKKPSVLRSQSETIGFVIMTAALVIAPFVTYPLFLMQAMCFALFACAFNLLIGYVGLLSFGHALYFGWASYLSAYSAKVWGFPPELAILTGTATAAVCGLVAGSLAIRRQGIYFAMRSEEHTSELQSPVHLVCRLLLEKKKKDPRLTRTNSA